VTEPAEREMDAWMAHLSEGDRAAFDPLFRALYPRAVRLARRRLGAADAQDAAQTILTKVFARASEFEPGRPLLPWFYAIAANEVQALGREAARRLHRTASEELATALPSDDDPERELLEIELRLALARAIDGLDETSAHAIAAMLDENERPRVLPAAFRKRVSRAYARLRLLLGGYDD
jgi:RNA polymerase sigma-70 factor (ECF subfamily)